METHEASACGAAMCDEGTTFKDGKCVPESALLCGKAACGAGTYLAENGKCRVLPPEGTPLRVLIDTLGSPNSDPRLKKTCDPVKNS